MFSPAFMLSSLLRRTRNIRLAQASVVPCGLALLVLNTSCARNPLSYQQKKEVVTVVIEPTVTSSTKVAPLVGLLAPIAIGAAVNLGKATLEKEAARYTANHSGNASTDAFYRGDAIGIKAIRYLRTSDGTDAVRFTLIPDASEDQRFFRLKLTDLTVSKAKAKLRANDNTVDLLIEVKMQGFWIDKDGKIHTETIGQTSFPVYGAEIGKPLPATELHISDWLPAVPRSEKLGNAPDSNGVASFAITVSEVDDYGARIKKLAGLIGDNTPSRDELKKLFGGD